MIDLESAVINFVQPGTRGLVLHVEPITCGQEDATEPGFTHVM